MSSIVITDLGMAKVASAVATQTMLDVSYFKIGSAIITPDATMTDITTLVYTGSGTELSIVSIGADLARFTVSLYAGTGPFTIGNIGLFCTDGTMFAIAGLDTVEYKTATVGAVLGNVMVYNYLINLVGVGSTINVTVNPPAAVTSVGVVDTDGNFDITNSPVTSNGQITIDLADNISIVNNLSVGDDANIDGTTTIDGSLISGTSKTNSIVVAGSSTGNASTITAQGSAANISVDIVPKGSGTLLVKGQPLVSAATYPIGTGTAPGSRVWSSRSIILTRVSDVFVMYTADWQTGQGPGYAQLYLDNVAVPGAFSNIAAIFKRDQFGLTCVVQKVLQSLSVGTHTIDIRTSGDIWGLYYDRGAFTIIPIGTL